MLSGNNAISVSTNEQARQEAVQDLLDFAQFVRYSVYKVPPRRQIKVQPAGTPGFTQSFDQPTTLVMPMPSQRSDKIGIEGITMKIEWRKQICFAKFIGVTKTVGVSSTKTASVLNELFIHLAARGANATFIAPMVNWYVINQLAKLKDFKEVLGSDWENDVFAYFYSSTIIDNIVQAATARGSSEDFFRSRNVPDFNAYRRRYKDLMTKISKRGEAIKKLKEDFKTLVGYEWNIRYSDVDFVIVLVIESAGDVSLANAYTTHGYGFPLERQLLTATGYQKYQNVQFIRAFGALVGHILHNIRMMGQLKMVHGDFHGDNLIGKTELIEDYKRQLFPTQLVFTWPTQLKWQKDGVGVTYDRGDVAYLRALKYANLPSFVPFFISKGRTEVPFPNRATFDNTNTLTFSVIDFGRSYMEINVMIARLGITESTKVDFLKKIYAHLGLDPLYPHVYHPWFDVFRLGFYMIRHIMASIYLVLGEKSKDFSPVLFDRLIKMMRTPSDVVSRDIRIYPRMKPVELVHQGYYETLYPTFRFSIEMVLFALKITKVPPEWETRTRQKKQKRRYSDFDKLTKFEKVTANINLLRMYLLTLCDFYFKIPIELSPLSMVNHLQWFKENEVRFMESRY